MARSNRRQPPRGASDSNTPASPSSKPAWRQSFDAWGGFTVFGSLFAVILVVGVLIYFTRPGSSTGGGAYVPIARAQVDGRTMGKPDAPVKIVAYEDFQCPFCKAYTHDTEPTLIADYVNTGKVEVQYVSFSFIGAESAQAAQAAECASDQNHFWDYHDVLFLRQGAENSGTFSTSNLKKFAREVADHFKDFDTAKFDQCLDSGSKSAAVESLTQQATKAGVTTTPTFTINGTKLAGAQPIATFRQAIDALLAAQGAR